MYMYEGIAYMYGRSNRIDGSDRSDRIDRIDRTDRSDRIDRTDRTDRIHPLAFWVHLPGTGWRNFMGSSLRALPPKSPLRKKPSRWSECFHFF